MLRSLANGTARRPALSTPTALLIVDIQTYTASINEGSEYFTGKFPSITSNIAEVASAFRATPNCEVVFTYLQSLTPDRRDISVDYKLSGPALCQIPGPTTNDDSLFLNDCHPIRQQDILLPKTSCSVFHSTNLHYVLSNLGIRHLVIVGQLTDQCITSAARGAADLGYYVTVVTDACVARSAAEEERGRANVAGFARLLDTAAVIQELRTARSQEQMLVQRVVDLLQSKGFHEAAQVVLEELDDGNSMGQEGTTEGPVHIVEDPVFELVPHPPKKEENDISDESMSIQQAGDSPVMVGAKKDMLHNEELLNTSGDAFTPFDMVAHPQRKANKDISDETESTVIDQQLDQRHDSEKASTQMASLQAGDDPSNSGTGEAKSNDDTRAILMDHPVSTPAEKFMTTSTKSDHVVAQTALAALASENQEADKLEESQVQSESITGPTDATTKMSMIPPSALQRVMSDPPTKGAGDGRQADGKMVDQQASMVHERQEIPRAIASEHTVARNTAATELAMIAGKVEAAKTADGSTIVPISIERAASDPPTTTTEEEEDKWNAALVSSIRGSVVSIRDPPSRKKQGLKQDHQQEVLESSSPAHAEPTIGDDALSANGFVGHSLISEISQTHPCDVSFIGTSSFEDERVVSFLKPEITDEAKHLSDKAGKIDMAAAVVQEEKSEFQMPQFEKMMEAVVKESPVTKQVAPGAGSAFQLAAETTKPGMSKMENAKGQPAGEEAAQEPIGRSSKAYSGDVKRITPQRRMMDPPASKSTAKSFIGKQLF